MRFLKWLNRNKPSDQRQKFEDTDEGKEFIEKYKASCEKRRLLKEEWERTTPQEKKDQVKLFDIIFPIFFFGYLTTILFNILTHSSNLYLYGCLLQIGILYLFPFIWGLSSIGIMILSFKFKNEFLFSISKP